MIAIRVDARKLVARLRRAARTLDRGVERLAEDLAKETRERLVTRYWENHDGTTADATRPERLGPASWRVVVDVPWAKYLDEGTDPHVIEPKASRLRAARKAAEKAKRFGKGKRQKGVALGPMAGGGPHAGKFYRRVNHPGTKGFYFTRKEAERGRRLLPRRCAALARRAFGRPA